MSLEKQRENNKGREQGKIVFQGGRGSLELVLLKVTDNYGEQFWQSLMGTGSRERREDGEKEDSESRQQDI